MLVSASVTPSGSKPPLAVTISTQKLPVCAVAGVVKGKLKLCDDPLLTVPLVQLMSVPLTPLTVPAPLLMQFAGKVPMPKPAGMATRTTPPVVDCGPSLT